MSTASDFFLILFLILFSTFSGGSEALAGDHTSQNAKSTNGSSYAGIEIPGQMSFNSVSSSSSSGCSMSSPEKTPNDRHGEKKPEKQTVKLHLKHRRKVGDLDLRRSVFEFKARDLSRIQTLHRRVKEKKNQITDSRLSLENEKPAGKNKKKKKLTPVVPPAESPESYSGGISGQLMATLESGMSLGSGEYFMDVFVGTPPKHFSLILDTGSDLNWIQCLPCHDCFEQNGAFYDPTASTSFRNITCKDPRCGLVSSPDPLQPCKSENQSCPYYYWYGDSSNTTGDFAVETFTVNLTMGNGNSEYKKVENMMFGCGHWNRGLFHGAAGLLGLGRGPLSFASQLQSLYGHSFSYCLVDMNSDTNASSKLIFGEDKGLLNYPGLNFTSFVGGNDNPADTFYYVQIKSILVDGEVLHIPEETWKLASDGSGGTIIDSGTTLSHFAEPAYDIIKNTLTEKLKGKHQVLRNISILDPCYNVSGVENVELPELGILFADDTVWNFSHENTFIRLYEDVVCLAVLGTPRSTFSIIGNYQQQNFHVLYDTEKSRLGFARTKCAD